VIDETNEAVLELEDSDFVPASNVGIGGGGERIFRLRAKSTGTSHVELKMKRVWEEDVPPIERYDFTIRVE
jgi:predicted secreted protein